MQPTMCSRCGKNVAVIFITKIENGDQKQEGLCLKCARELHIKPVDDVINKMGLTDEDIENLSGDMMNALSGMDGLMEIDPDADPDADGEDTEDEGKTATFPFLNRLFGAQNGPQDQNKPQQEGAPQQPSQNQQGGRPGKRSFLIITASTSTSGQETASWTP